MKSFRCQNCDEALKSIGANILLDYTVYEREIDGWPGSLVTEFHHRQGILLNYIVNGVLKDTLSTNDAYVLQRKNIRRVTI